MNFREEKEESKSKKRSGNKKETGSPYQKESGSHEIVPLFVFADIEAMQEHGAHQPNLLIAKTDESDKIHGWQGVTCIEKFSSWLEGKRSEDERQISIFLFNNFQGYDPVA